VKKTLVISGAATAALVFGGVAAALPSADAHPVAPAAHGTKRVCTAHPAPGFATCQAIAVTGAGGKLLVSSRPLESGFTPTDIEAAYNLKGLKSGGRTVAIVDAYGYPTLESDLALYRKTYGLPPCTTQNGCLRIENQYGHNRLPAANSGWDVEQALDVDAVSAACPDCHILVVQSKTNGGYNMMMAANTAALTKGVAAVSNSYTAAHDRRHQNAYYHRGIAIVAATGDSGFQGGAYPASDTHVVAVGGTSVTRDGSKRGYSETAWSGAGSGCSKVSQQPRWQEKLDTGCQTKAMSDVSAAADPNNGGLTICLNGAFSQVGGTSEATPIIAAVYALSGDTSGFPGRLPYHHPSDLYDVTSGSNGACGAPLCTAGKGWDGPTGMGTPDGVKGF
jgi:subtilase family serine protease